MKIKLLLFSLLFLLATTPALSQKKGEKTPSAPLEIKANVLVLDAAGQQVNDVKAEDLKIFEDGVEQKITYFAKKDNKLNVGFVVDNSGSLRYIFENLIKLCSAATAELRPEDEAFVIRFVSGDKIEILQDWTSSKNAINRAFENMFPEGGLTAITDALALSTEHIIKRESSDKSKRHAIILITDGDDRASYFRLENVMDKIKGTDIQVFVLALRGDLNDQKRQNAETYINRLALETGGRVFRLTERLSLTERHGTPKGELKSTTTDALKSLAIELRSQYVIGYTSTNQKRDGLIRKLTVQIADDTKRQAVIRESFVVPENK